MVDENNGRIIFGNGLYGKIPPAKDTETIKVKYSVGKGDVGNAKTGEINSFADAVPFIKEVFNFDPVLGGCAKRLWRVLYNEVLISLGATVSC